MRNQKVPDDRLKSFGMRSDPVRVHHRNEHRDIGDLRRVAAIPAHDTDDTATNRSCIVESRNDVRAYIPLDAASADRVHQYRIARLRAAGFQPRRKHGLPPFIIDSGCEFRDISVGAYASIPVSLRKSFTACEALAALPPTPMMNKRPPRSRTLAKRVAIFSIASTSSRPAISATSARNEAENGTDACAGFDIAKGF